MTDVHDTTSTGTTPDPAFEPPGPGRWEHDISHTTASPTPVFRRVSSTVMPVAYRQVFADFGGPLDTLDVRFVHGAMYRRLVPLVGANSHRPPPPAPLMWLALRLHPAFRKRERAARRLWRERPDLDVVAEWHRTEREHWIERNLEVQRVDVAELDDAGLAAHLRACDAHLLTGWRRHHVLHGSDVGPIGDLLVHGRDWGLDVHDLLTLLRGSSPATSAAARHAADIAVALRTAGVDPATVHDVATIRSVPAAAELLDDWLELVGWHVVTSYDIEAETMHELPGATCALVRAAAVRPTDDADDDRADELRARVPAPDRPRFDELLALARSAYGMRDDNGPLTAEWPMGLLRRAFLEAGRRLTARGHLDDGSDVFELDTDEVARILDGAGAPTIDDVRRRAEVRRAERRLSPPAALGPVADEPDLSLFPRGIRRTLDIVVTAFSLLEAPADDEHEDRTRLTGLGIGDRVHQGRARVVDGERAVDDVFAEMEPGDVLVAPWTAPTFNPLFAIAGAVVVREGGPLCHAAVMARELGIPTVIGCRDALDLIADGALVEVDPAGGRVRLLSER